MSKLHIYSGLLTWALASLSFSLVGCSSKDAAKNGGQSGVCTQGETRQCLGPAACTGAQICQADLTWTTCDCGSSGGGSSGTGGNGASGGASASSTTGVGGSSSPATGGAGGVAAETGGASSSATTGGTTSAATGGQPSATGGGPSATGGATSAATGGASSVVTGGSPSTGGTSTAGGSSSSPYLVFDSGWVADPAHGLQGPAFTYADSGGSNITPNCKTDSCFTGKTTQLCVTGQVAKAVDSTGASCELTSSLCDWTTYWGAAMAINPNQAQDATTPSAWDASKYTGISFAMTVNTLPPNLRVYLNLIDGSQFCYQFTATKSYSLTWSQFKTNCYTTGGTSPTTANLTQVQSIAWQAGTNASQVGFFDFCVDQVKIQP